MDMFFHIANIERDIYWQLGNITCSAYPLKYLGISIFTFVNNKDYCLNIKIENNCDHFSLTDITDLLPYLPFCHYV